MSTTTPSPLKTFQVDSLTVEVYPCQTCLAKAAACEAQRCLQEALGRQPTAAAIMASAASQVQFLEQLTALTGIEWSRAVLFHMDEYLGIPAGHPASFRRFMRERVDLVVKPKAFHYLQGDAMEPVSECRRYGELLQSQAIDLCCLGVGENGHIAFNDPPVANFSDEQQVKIVKLDEACRMQQVGEGAFPALEAVPQYALSLSIPALCAARRMLCVVPETRKAKAVKSMLQGPIATACPASILRRMPQATLYLDADSASLL